MLVLSESLALVDVDILSLSDSLVLVDVLVLASHYLMCLLTQIHFLMLMYLVIQTCLRLLNHSHHGFRCTSDSEPPIDVLSLSESDALVLVDSDVLSDVDVLSDSDVLALVESLSLWIQMYFLILNHLLTCFLIH